MDWISVKDQLPEETIICLVCNDDMPGRFYIAMFWSSGKLFEVNNLEGRSLYNAIPYHATHWMPINMPETKEVN